MVLDVRVDRRMLLKMRVSFLFAAFVGVEGVCGLTSRHIYT